MLHGWVVHMLRFSHQRGLMLIELNMAFRIFFIVMRRAQVCKPAGDFVTTTLLSAIKLLHWLLRLSNELNWVGVLLIFQSQRFNATQRSLICEQHHDIHWINIHVVIVSTDRFIFAAAITFTLGCILQSLLIIIGLVKRICSSWNFILSLQRIGCRQFSHASRVIFTVLVFWYLLKIFIINILIGVIVLCSRLLLCFLLLF